MTDDLSKGVPCAESWRFVRTTDPALVKAWEEAREADDQNDRAWHERNTEHQIRSGRQRRRLESPYAMALREADAAVTGKLVALLASGQIVYAGYPDGKLDGDPQVIPLALLGKRRPGGQRFSVRGVTFHDVRLYPAEAFKRPGAPRGRRRAPKNAREQLNRWVADYDNEEKTDVEVAAEVAAAHPEVLQPAGWWSKGTLEDYVGQHRPLKH